MTFHPGHVKQTFIKTPAFGKEEYLLDTIQKDVSKGNKVIVFSNKTSTSNFVAHFLAENNVPCGRFNGGMDLRERSESYERFSGGEFPVLSCTDLASRGMDTRWAIYERKSAPSTIIVFPEPSSTWSTTTSP